MKKFIYCFIMCTAIVANTSLAYANTDLYMEFHDYYGNTIGNSDTLPSGELYGHDASCFIRTTEYIYKDGVCMVKLRDAINAVNGKLEYIPESKLTKCYLPREGQYFVGCSINAVAVQAGRNRIDYSNPSINGKTMDQYSFYTTVTPQIINNSLYVGANDLSNVLTHENGRSFIKDGKLYIEFYINAA